MSFLWAALLWATGAFAESSYLPVQASDIAGAHDLLYNVLTAVSLVAFIGLMAAMIYFIVKYRRRSDNDKTAYIEHNHFLEFLWSFIPLVVFLGVFYWGWVVYKEARVAKEGAIQINITGYQWYWKMDYANGKSVENEMTVPVGKPVSLIMRSNDVLHSFYVPSFRVKQDVVPGYISKLHFVPTKVGRYRIFCAEYCGTAHSGMIGWVNVVEEHEFEDWLNEKQEKSLADLGQSIYKTRCAVCHSVDGAAVVGPTFKGLIGRTSSFVDGSSAKVDENYIRESILNPMAKVVKGYAPSMPAFQGQLNEDQITQLIEYMKTLN
jgi:cytochrome c oxidase subunit 2